MLLWLSKKNGANLILPASRVGKKTGTSYPHFSHILQMSGELYTTNIIEGLNRQFRNITNGKPSFTNDDSLRKMLYLASKKIVEHWTVHCRNWDRVLNQLEIMFADREAS